MTLREPDYVGVFDQDSANSSLGHTTSYTYDNMMRLATSVDTGSSTEIVYDALGNKVALMSATTTLKQAFVPLPAGATAVYNASGLQYYRHADRLGSTAQVSDYTGAMAQDQLYYPFGQEWSMVGNYQEVRFARLQHRDTTETGLDPTVFRMYASSEGRWFSADPVRACPLHPQGFNRYSYAAGDPVNHVDPTGRYIIDPLDPGCFDPGCGCDPFTDFSCDPGFCDPSDPTCGGGLGGDGGGGDGGGGLDPCQLYQQCLTSAQQAYQQCLQRNSTDVSTCKKGCVFVCLPALLSGEGYLGCVAQCEGGCEVLGSGGAALCWTVYQIQLITYCDTLKGFCHQ